MITIRKGRDRGGFDHGWLNTKHTFSFAGYYDPRFMGFRSLRVINEDWVKPRQGFGMHGHRDMEIVTYIVSGELEHKDSLGSGSVIRPGEIQRMSAGTGVRHSEFNPSASETVHLLQIWIEPSQEGLMPEYEQKHFAVQSAPDRLHVLVSQDGAEGSVRINQDVRILAGTFNAGQTVGVDIANGRASWIQVVKGSFDVNGSPLEAGDGAAVESISHVELRAITEGEIIVFDLA